MGGNKKSDPEHYIDALLNSADEYIDEDNFRSAFTGLRTAYDYVRKNGDKFEDPVHFYRQINVLVGDLTKKAVKNERFAVAEEALKLGNRLEANIAREESTPDISSYAMLVVSFAGLLFGVFLIGFNLTGNVVGNLTGEGINWAGLSLISLGVAGLLAHFRLR